MAVRGHREVNGADPGGKTFGVRKRTNGPPDPTDRVRKLTFNEKRELEELPDRIEAMEAELEQIHTRLADPDLYRHAADGSGDEPATLTTRLETLDDDIAAALRRWEELETVRENEATRL